MRILFLLLVLAASLCVASAKSGRVAGILGRLRGKFGRKGSHPKPSHPKPSHPKPSHPKPSHPKPSHPKPSHPKPVPKPVIPTHPKPWIKPIPWRPRKCNYCVKNAQCNRHQCCECKHGYKGDGYFLCLKPKEYDVCRLCDDPILSTESNYNAGLHYLGATLLMDKTVTSPGRKCRIQVIVNNERRRGKLFPKCVFIRFDIKYTRSSCSFAYKICAHVRKDWSLSWDIRYGVYTRSGHLHLRPYRTLVSTAPSRCDDKRCNCDVNFNIGTWRLLTMEAKCCNFKFGFRPYVKKSDWLKSGIYILTPKTSDDRVNLPSNLLGYPVCLAPGVGIPQLQSALGLPGNRQHAVSHLALTNLKPSHPMVTLNPGQGEMAGALRKCDGHGRRRFYKKFGFILDSPMVIHAVSGEGSGLAEMMALVEHAANWLCGGKEESCGALMNILTTRCKPLLKQEKRFADLVKFVNDGCD